MGKLRKRDEGAMQPNEHITPDGPVSMAAGLEQPASSGTGRTELVVAARVDADGSEDPRPPQSFAAKVAEDRRIYSPSPDPFAIATINTPDNSIHLGKSQRLRAFLIRFNNNPNDGRDKADPHPVIALLKDAGYRYRSLPGDGYAWQKPWENGTYQLREELDSRGVANRAAEAMGAKIEAGISR